MPSESPEQTPEQRLRTEVHRIADGVPVDTEAHLATVLAQQSDPGRHSQRHRALVPLAAAAAVLGVVVAGSAVTGLLTGDRNDEPAAILAGTPEGTVPSVFGQTRSAARTLLEQRGLQVRFEERISCDPAGRPVGTEPTTGTPVARGDTVTVLVAYQGANTDCVADLREPWSFVDFATGRGPAPRFAEDVAVFVDGRRTATLSGEKAAQGDWGPSSPLTLLAGATEQVLRTGTTYTTPELQATTGTPPDRWCGVARPRAVAEREALTLTIAFADGAEPCPTRVALYETGGAIDAVVAWSGGDSTGARRPVPDVVGMSLAEARAAVTAAGYPARVEELETCAPRAGVVEQAPTPQDLIDDRADEPDWSGPVTLVVEVPHTTRDCAALDAAAETFLRFARGGPPPAWAPQVRQLLGYAPWDTVTASRADDPEAWALCSGVTPSDCEVSPLRVAGQAVEVSTGEYADVGTWPGDEVCELIDRGGLPLDLRPRRQIVLYPAAPATCADNWQVWLWIDDAGRIAAVNLGVPR